VDVVWATRNPAAYNLQLKASSVTCASLGQPFTLALGARAHAFLNGRGYVDSTGREKHRPHVFASLASSSATKPRLRRSRVRTLLSVIFAGIAGALMSK